ncbi:MAG: hypothetical protein FJ382_00620 [Verrucomicrobia bacterium]|nr:hypothetical protein [Verrucomicrobiota bacterium]
MTAPVLRLCLSVAALGPLGLPGLRAESAPAAASQPASVSAASLPAPVHLAAASTIHPTPTAAAFPRPLPGGPAYVRARDLAQLDLAATPAEAIVDLRSLGEATAEGIAQLRTLLAAGSAGTLRLVLIDPATAGELQALVKAASGRILTLGANLPPGAVDVAVATTTDLDGRAVAALDAGRAPHELLGTRPEKARYDESSMVRDHAKGLPIPDAPPEADESSDHAKPPTGLDSETALVDHVLERALHLHRALRAIRRI